MVMKERNLLVVCAALAIAAGCGAKKEAVEEKPIAHVQVAEARLDSIQRVVKAEAILYPLDRASIMPKISAPVKSFSVNRGDRVGKGQLLAVLENSDLAAAVSDAKGGYEQSSSAYRNISTAGIPNELTKAQQDAQSAKQSMEATKRVYESRQSLLKEGAIARRLVDEANVAYVTSQSQYEVARRNLESLQAVGRHEELKSAQGQLDSAKGKLDAALAQLSYSQIRSPISGVVTERSVYPGEMASAGTPLLTVMDVSSVIARASIPQAQAALVKVGNPATITDPDDGAEIAGKVTVVSPALDPSSTTVEVWVQIPNSDSKLRPGTSVHLAIVAQTVANALLIPASALLPTAEGPIVVLVVEGDTAHERKIESGIRDQEKVQILKGLKAGEKVIVAGGLGLEDKAKVQIDAAGEKKEKEKE